MMSVIFGSNSLNRRSVVPLGLAEEEGVSFPSDESLGYSLSSLRDCIIEKKGRWQKLAVPRQGSLYAVVGQSLMFP